VVEDHDSGRFLNLSLAQFCGFGSELVHAALHSSFVTEREEDAQGPAIAKNSLAPGDELLLLPGFAISYCSHCRHKDTEEFTPYYLFKAVRATPHDLL
jgi:hypothetical protein